MAEIWVANASPLIALAAAGLEHLLTALSPTLLVPAGVAAEILAGPTSDPARKLLERGWAQTIVPNAVPPAVVEWGLGRGESEVLAVCLETSGSTALLDDAAARTAARSLGIPLMGTLGIVLRAKKQQLLPSAATAIAQLQTAGLYLDDALIRAVLQQVGESWPPPNAADASQKPQANP